MASFNMNNRRVQPNQNASSTSLSSMHSSFSDSSWATASTPVSDHDVSFDPCMSDSTSFTNSFTLLPTNSHEYMAMSMTPQVHHSMAFTPNSSFSQSASDLLSFDCPQLYSNNTQSFVDNHGLPSPPMDLGNYSPMNMSHASVTYVAPSETTFGNHFDACSPIRPQSSLNLQITYNSPMSNHSEISLEDINNQCFNGSYREQNYRDHTYRSTLTPVSSVASTPSRSPVNRQIKLEVSDSCNALQQIQKGQTENNNRKKIKKERRAKRSKYNGPFPENVTRIERAIYHCGFPECKSTFGKSEHWKRHEETVHHGERFPCGYCKEGAKSKTFQMKRLDNYKTHLELHLQKTPRTHYNLNAVVEIARLIMNRKVKKGSKKTPISEPIDAVNEVINAIKVKEELDDATLIAIRQRLLECPWTNVPDCDPDLSS